MNKVAYLIPGFGYRANNQTYLTIASIFRKNGIEPKIVDIKWHRRTMEDYVLQFMSQYDGSSKNHAILFGFSLGANIAILSSQKIKTKNLVLCSISPYFKEDKKVNNNVIWYLKPYQMILEFLVSPAIKSMKKYSSNLLNKINYRTYIIVGKQELAISVNKAKDTHKRIKNSKLILTDAGHDIGNANYLKTLEAIIQKI